MKMHAILVKHGFGVIVAFCYNICLLRNPVVTVLKAIGFEDFVRENKLPLWRPGRSPQPLGNSCNLKKKEK